VEESVLVVVSLSLIIVAGVSVIWMGMQSRRQIREMEHRERLAMIERGILPSPELDPAGFEARMSPSRPADSPASTRSRTAGIMMIGLGFAFMFLVSLAAGEPGVGVGIGGAFALIGAAFFVNAVMLSRANPAYPPPYSRTTPPPFTPAPPPRPPHPPEPPPEG
jgi:Flp pilus assembly protein TadB